LIKTEKICELEKEVEDKCEPSVRLNSVNICES
jgi:hypothetical protein